MIVSIPEAFERLGEPPLDQPSSAIREAYRLVIYGHPPGQFDIIRAEQRNSEHFRFALVVHRVRCDARLRDRVQSWEADLYEAQWSCLQALVGASGFWELPSEGGRIGIRGYFALLEGHRAGKYHQASRWCPRHRDDHEWFELPCCYLTDLADWLVPEVGQQSAPADRDLMAFRDL
jgi:hypothetical protein